jgi:hypothetical protein
MRQRRIVTTPEADEGARRIDQWWVRNRGAASNLFIEELAHAIALLGMEAGIGVRCVHRAIPGLRLYFVYNDDLVVIVGIWGATRRTTPGFADRAASTRSALAAVENSTTVPGFVNRNEQEVVRPTDLPGTDHLQRIYELLCHSCGHRYGSNGSDNFQRKCPKCQGGATGLPLA